MNNDRITVDNDDLIKSLFVALSGYTKAAYLEGYDNALLNKTSSGKPKELFLDSNTKKQIAMIIQNFAPKDISIPEDYTPCPNCLRLVAVAEYCTCQVE